MTTLHALTCDYCHAVGPDEVGLSLPDQEYRFCSTAHMVLYVRNRYMLGGTAA